ncbi:hypothetical protein HID58_021968 [Brassica napus]|uniref:Uncharacterized protein n=1 Tax=Brassica napus TaxID=3708 RepID=A0ABQ8CXX2_BRANA|nr:hypothetical protein HID58_021968 [Brassica napus]
MVAEEANPAEQSQIEQKLEVETESLNKVTAPRLHQRRHDRDSVTEERNQRKRDLCSDCDSTS